MSLRQWRSCLHGTFCRRPKTNHCASKRIHKILYFIVSFQNIHTNFELQIRLDILLIFNCLRTVVPRQFLVQEEVQSLMKIYKYENVYVIWLYIQPSCWRADLQLFKLWPYDLIGMKIVQTMAPKLILGSLEKFKNQHKNLCVIGKNKCFNSLHHYVLKHHTCTSFYLKIV